jgi:hypothetical protein
MPYPAGTENACSVLAELQRIQVERLTRILWRLCGNVGRIRILTDGLDLARLERRATTKNNENQSVCD